MKYIIITILAVSFILLANVGMNKKQYSDCQKLYKQEQTQSNFYWANWQIEMCKDIPAE